MSLLLLYVLEVTSLQDRIVIIWCLRVLGLICDGLLVSGIQVELCCLHVWICGLVEH